MNDLSDETRALLARVSSADGPSRDDRNRVLALVGGTLAAPSAAAATTGGSAAAATAASGGATKLVLAFIVSLGVGGLATTAGKSLWRGAQRGSEVAVVLPPPPLTAPSQPMEIETIAEPAAVPSPPAVRKANPAAVRVEPVQPEQPPATPEVAQRPPVARSDQACELSAELAVIQQAQQSLKKDPAQAIAGLQAFGARCPSGALLEERLATHALALCAHGKQAEGRAVAQELSERFPASPSLERVTQACDR